MKNSIFNIKTLVIIVALTAFQQAEAQKLPFKKKIKKAAATIEKVTTPKAKSSETTIVSSQNTATSQSNTSTTNTEVKKDSIVITGIERLDMMLTEARSFNTIAEKFDEACRELELVQGESLNGTAEEQILALNKIVIAFEKFEKEDQAFAESIISDFTKSYRDAHDFMTTYKEVYSKVEEEIATIDNNEKRRTINSELSNEYQYIIEPQMSYMKRSLSKLQEYKKSIITKVIRSASSTASTIEYQKTGKDINDRLSGAYNSLKLVQKLNPDSRDIKEKLEELKLIGEKQITKLKEAWAANRFPKRYSGGSAPANAAELEKMGIALFKKNNPNRKAYKAAIADGWVTVHNIYGAPIYNQIDIFIAVEDPSNSKIANVNYFTFKTSSPKSKSAFTTYSVANLKDMYVANLNK